MDSQLLAPMPTINYYVDEAGDGVLFGPKGRDRLQDTGAHQFFMLGMIACADEAKTIAQLSGLRASLLANPLYAGIPSMQSAAGKTARAFHAKDDHPEIRSKVFDLIVGLDFKFYAVIKDMRKVREYVDRRNQVESTYRYHPNELYDLTVRMLFKERLHKDDHCRVVFARRGHSDRTAALTTQLEQARRRFLSEHQISSATTVSIIPAYPWEEPCVQIADYCLWALQRCYEKHEARFLHALWPKVSLVHDVDDPAKAGYGSYLRRKDPPPDPQKIRNRWI
jgi:hypothetical protein